MPRKAKPKRQTSADGTVKIHGKAANGEGSLYQQNDGTWRATFYLPGDPKRRYASGSTRDRALARRDERIAAALSAAPTPSRFTTATTVDELAAFWLDNVAVHNVRPTSLPKYRQRVARFGALGAVAVADVRAEGVAEWQSQLLHSGLKSGTVKDTRTVLRQVLEQGVEYRLLSSNPVDRVRAPKVEREPARALSTDEVHKLLGAVDENRFGAAIALLFVNGWRASETLGLAWSDLSKHWADADEPTATVARAAVDNPVRFGPTKSDGATGVHLLSPTTVELLRQRGRAQAAEQLRCPTPWTEHTYNGAVIKPVFTTATGGLVNRQSLNRELLRCCRAAGIDCTDVSTHSGRASVVTNGRNNGVAVDDLARHIGHASAATTAGYERHAGTRPRDTALAIARLHDPAAHG